MAYYTKQTWIARTGTDLNKFTDVNTGNTLILTSAATGVNSDATPFTADRMNHMEDGIAAASWSYGTADPSALTNPSEGQLYFKIV